MLPGHFMSDPPRNCMRRGVEEVEYGVYYCKQHAPKAWEKLRRTVITRTKLREYKAGK